MNDIFINVEEEAVYPSSSSSFSPHIAYPEYKWSSSGISGSRNDVYDMVRSCLIGLGMDSANTGTEKWNPFGEFIREGDTVVIKPNWVMHFNKNKNVSENALECLFTHPSVVRPVIDYCLIALNGTGRIIVGDAPMQGCDLEELIEISGYKELFSFYNQKGLDINPVDFRQFATLVDKNKVLTGRKYNKNQGLEVDLKEKSRFSTIGSARRYKVSDYNENTTASYHNDQKHSYLINSDVISADVIINLCKPKCHRLAGITAAVKNIVGITYDKACLPHRTIGSRQDGGDEYLHRSIIKKLIAWVLAWKIKFEEQNKLRLSLAMRYLYGSLYYLMRAVSKDKYLVGSWYGNDTIWRTVLDLYAILMFADKKGNLSPEKQRRIFNIADMIISGEGNGPVAPEPKKLGFIIAGSDPIVMDRVVCEIMGFDYSKIPMLVNAGKDGSVSEKNPENILLLSNNGLFNKKKINELFLPSKWKFKPYESWTGHIEKK